MDYKLAIENCLMLQDKMNKTVDVNWVTKGRSWEIAMIVELAEFIDHVGYKWWKKQEPNFAQAFIEVVDVFHFFLSRQIEHYTHTSITKDEIVSNIHNVVETISKVDLPKIDHSHEVDRKLISDTAVTLIGAISVSTNSESEETAFNYTTIIMAELAWLTRFCGKSLDDLLKTYIAKNTLNIFRQHNGYKEGNYVKDWKGKEDNEVMWEIIQNDPAIGIDFDLLYDALATKYKEVTGA